MLARYDGKPSTEVKLDDAVEQPASCVMLGLALIPARIVELLRELGAKSVITYGRLDPVRAPGLVLAMPVDGEAERDSLGRVVAKVSPAPI